MIFYSRTKGVSMKLFGLLKKTPVKPTKNVGKCAECFCAIRDCAYKLDNKNDCHECYNRKMAVRGQTGNLIFGSPKTFFCNICNIFHYFSK